MGNTHLTRCPWCLKDPAYIKYHDEEWGVPVHDDKKHFEFIVLETSQAGLSWLTVLKKRSEYFRSFDGFDPVKVASYDENDFNMLLTNPGIIRNKQKIRSAINNAAKFLEIQKEFGSFDKYIWRFTDFKPLINSYDNDKEIPPSTGLSLKISIDLKKRGFTFVGSTIVYAHLQATGLVNDHLTSCFRYGEIIQSYTN